MKVPSYESCGGFAALWHGACEFCRSVQRLLECGSQRCQSNLDLEILETVGSVETSMSLEPWLFLLVAMLRPGCRVAGVAERTRWLQISSPCQPRTVQWAQPGCVVP